MFLHLKFIYFFKTTYCRCSGGIIFFLSLNRILPHMLKSIYAFSSNVLPMLFSAWSALSPIPSVGPQQNLIPPSKPSSSVASAVSLLKLFRKCNILPLPRGSSNIVGGLRCWCGPCGHVASALCWV